MKMIPAPFTPGTYLEVKEGRPFVARLGGVWYSTRYQSAISFVRFVAVKERVLKYMSDAAQMQGADAETIAKKQLAMVHGLRVLILSLWEVRERKGVLREAWRFIRRDKVRFYNFFMENVDRLWEILENVLDYNGRLLRWNAIPSSMADHAGSSVERDWFRDFCEGFDASTAPWIVICHDREQNKIKAIGEWEANERAIRESKRRRK